MNFASSSYNDMNSVVKQVARDIHIATENAILDQLNDFVSRGLIVIESSQPVLVQDPFSNQVLIKQAVRLTLKDKEYIETLEKENLALKDALVKVNAALERSMK